MRGFELEPGSFFMCTETSPRCFIIQQVKVNDLDQALSDVKTSTEHDAPMLPFLPWWFTSECRQQLLSVPNESATHLQSGQSGERSGTPDPNQMTPEQLKARLKTQLEYYFSRENLITDRFLRCQMDADQYVPVKILASFPKIAALTSDTKMITEVLKESAQVQVDEIGEKVRPVTKRCTIILREIPENADEKEVKSMFDGCPPYRSLFYGLNNSWYVTFDTEEATQKAFLHLQNLGKTFNNKPVYARIKTGGAPLMADGLTYAGKASPDPVKGYITVHDINHNCIATTQSTAVTNANNVATSNGTVVYGPHNFNLGQILANYGYVPRATYRPAVSTPTVATSGSRVGVPVDSTSVTFAQPTFLPRAQISMVGSDCSTYRPAGVDSLSVPSGPFYDSTTAVSDGLLPDPPLLNLGRQRITDAPRINKSRRSPVAYEHTKSGDHVAVVHGNNNNTSPYTPLNKVHVPNTSASGTSEWTNVRSGSYRGNRENRRSKGFYHQDSRGNYRDATRLSPYQSNNQQNSGNYHSNSYVGKSGQRSFDAISHSGSSGGGSSQSNRTSAVAPPKNTSEATTKPISILKSTQCSSTNCNSVPVIVRSECNESTTSTNNSCKDEETSSNEPRQKQNSESQEYNFVEVEFPCLIEKEKKQQREKEKLPFSAVVAGKRALTKTEEKKTSYAQTLKKRPQK